MKKCFALLGAIMPRQKREQKRPLAGFTLIELIIAIFVLSVAVVGIFSVFSAVVFLSSDADDRLAAAYLAQEGMEIVRNLRDNNWLAEKENWRDGISPCVNCIADYTTGTGVNGATLFTANDTFLNDNNGVYGYNSAENPTKFKRRITVAPLSDFQGAPLDYVLKVTVQVSWTQKATLLNAAHSAAVCASTNCITTEETLYNWY